MRIFYRIVFVLIFSFCVFDSAFSQANNWVWAKSAGGNSWDTPRSIAVDDSGNIFVGGIFRSQFVVFGNDTLIDSTNWGGINEVFIAKYDASGNALWAKASSGSSYDHDIKSVTVDDFGNIYAIGHFRDTLTFDSITLTGSSMLTDIFLVKYNNQGVLQWLKSFGDIYMDVPAAITIDSANNLYVTGYFESDSITFGSVTLYANGNVDMFIAKLDTSGNTIWAKSAYGAYCPCPSSLTTDGSCNIYVSGTYSYTATFDTITFTTPTYSDMYIVKYDSSGNVLWAHNAVGNSMDYATSVKADDFGGVYITGYFKSTDISFDTTTLININPDSSDIFLVKYDNMGNVIWAKKAGGNNDDYAYGVTVDISGNISLVGTFRGNSAFFDSIILTNSPSSASSMFIAKYDNNGSVFWAESPMGTGYEGAAAVAANGIGNIYVTGNFGGPGQTMTFGNTILICNNPGDIFLAKLDAPAGISNIQYPIFNLLITPNPFTTTLTIKGTTQKGELIIFDVTGKEILRAKTFSEETKINTAHLTSGFYFVNYREGDKTINIKAVKAP